MSFIGTGFLAAVIGVFVVLLASELLWRKKVLRGEAARKFVHIVVGTFVAAWPTFMSWREIQAMSLAFLIVVVLSQQRNVFHAVHGVARKTWGEVFFAIGIGVAAFLEPSKLVFAAAILHLSVADGLAALVGKRYGLLHQYKIRNYTKTLAGTCTFWIVSNIIVITTLLAGNAELGWTTVLVAIWLPLAATLAENVGVRGVDNVLVPLLIIGVLRFVPGL